LVDEVGAQAYQAIEDMPTTIEIGAEHPDRKARLELPSHDAQHARFHLGSF